MYQCEDQSREKANGGGGWGWLLKLYFSDNRWSRKKYVPKAIPHFISIPRSNLGTKLEMERNDCWKEVENERKH